MERLTEIIYKKGYCKGKSACEDNCEECKHFETMVDRLAYYEDLEEQGLLLRLPCKVGTEVYVISEECEGDPFDCHHCCESCACSVLDAYVEKFDVWMLDGIGKTVFLTKEEAEQKLAEMKGE